MLRRLAIVIYWIGFMIGGLFLLLDFYLVLILLDILPRSETGSPWFGIVIVTPIGLFSWGVGWITRFVVTGATGISPMAKGKNDVLANDLEGNDI